MTILTKDNFQCEVEQYEGLVVIDLYADWCGPCKMLAPILEELDGEYENVKFCKVNVDEQPELAAKFKVMTIPTLMVFKNGQAVQTSVGVKSKNEILNMLNA